MNCKQVIVVRKDLNMRKGKIAAQASHASMGFLLDSVRPYPECRECRLGNHSAGEVKTNLTKEQYAWLTDPESAHAKVVVSVDSEQELRTLIAYARSKGFTVHEIIDAGRTEFDGVPTLTCAAFGPHEVSKFAGVTDHLKLL